MARKEYLTSYNVQTITYDAIGNPLSYRDGITLTWKNGRELATYTNDSDGTEVTYTYDASGMRSGKTVTKDGTTTQFTYVYEGGLLRQMTRGARIYDFSYDANGTPVSMSYRINATTNPTYYYYGTNSRGDVAALYNSSGSITALYEYDAYGNVTVKSTNGQVNTSESHIANINPIRYRGYVYDTETGLYYLQSRYYDPETCRFINADGYCATGVGITGNNMFAYCNNNPVMCIDPTGEHTLGEVCGDPTCAMCNSERREFLQNNIEWYNDTTKSNLIFVTEEGLLFFESETESDISLTKYNYIAFDDNLDTYDNPSIKVWNSYIYEKDEEVMSIVILNLLCYEEVFRRHNSWERNYQDMMCEWDVHNFYYNPSLNFTHRCKDVDFDFRDREKGWIAYTYRIVPGE